MNHGKHKTVQVGIITVSLAKKHFTVQKFFSFEIALFFHIGRFFSDDSSLNTTIIDSRFRRQYWLSKTLCLDSDKGDFLIRLSVLI